MFVRERERVADDAQTAWQFVGILLFNFLRTAYYIRNKIFLFPSDLLQLLE